MVPHLGGELGASIGHEGFWYTIELEDIGVEGIRGFLNFHWGDWDKVSHFDKTVNKDEDVTIGNSYKGT